MNNTIDEVQEIKLDGFQVVKGDLFKPKYGRVTSPTLTIWNSSINFSKASLVALSNCERIRIEVNRNTRGILIVPVTTKDSDGVRWSKNVKEPAPRKIECFEFANQLYEQWGWKKEFVHRANGRLVSADNKVMLYFDFSNPESWKFEDKKAANTKGKKDE